MGNREIMPSNKTKEEIVEAFSLRLIGSFWSTVRISQKLLTGDFANGELPSFSKLKSLGQGLSTLT